MEQIRVAIPELAAVLEQLLGGVGWRPVAARFGAEAPAEPS